MSHSITTTASYVLNKYSRSYPSATPVQSLESEWQHFTNPVMKIVLEAKKSPSGQLLSMRLRILWSLLQTDSTDMNSDQREVVFEDLELLSFSSLPTFQTSASLQLDQGLPLKAVYRDAVVGIRYLHPKIIPPGSPPASTYRYRRFQITFKDALDASRCIDAIKSVCPCKANPQPAQVNRHSTMIPSSLARAATTVPTPVHPPPARLPERQSMIVPMTRPDLDPRSIPSFTSHPLEEEAVSITPSMPTGPSSDDTGSAFVKRFETPQGTETRTQGNRHMNDNLNGPQSRRVQESIPSSLPNSSQPSSSNQSGAMPPPPVPQRATGTVDVTPKGPSGTTNIGDERSHLLAALSQHPPLYDMPRADLETLVSQVIREEGFLQLLESLDSLWRIKGLVDH